MSIKLISFTSSTINSFEPQFVQNFSSGTTLPKSKTAFLFTPQQAHLQMYHLFSTSAPQSGQYDFSDSIFIFSCVHFIVQHKLIIRTKKSNIKMQETNMSRKCTSNTEQRSGKNLKRRMPEKFFEPFTRCSSVVFVKFIFDFV